MGLPDVEAHGRGDVISLKEAPFHSCAVPGYSGGVAKIGGRGGLRGAVVLFILKGMHVGVHTVAVLNISPRVICSSGCVNPRAQCGAECSVWNVLPVESDLLRMLEAWCPKAIGGPV